MKELPNHHSDILVKAAKQSTSKAIKRSKALGLEIVYLEKGVLYKEFPDGTKEIIGSKKTASKPTRVFKKGMVFHAKN